MYKIILSSILVTATVFSCKKNDAGADNKSTIEITNVDAVTNAIKVFHGEKLSGNPPTSTTSPNTPVLYEDSNEQTIQAKVGGYAVIEPEVTSGEVAGYYFKIIGANSYYKVDYSKPRGARIANLQTTTRKQRHTFFTRRNQAGSSRQGNEDSLLVIKIPDNITPGTFCIEYCVYDYENNVSNPVKVCVIVSEIGAGATESGLVGSWKYTGYKEDTGLWIYGDTAYYEYAKMRCVNDILEYGECSGLQGCTPINILTRYEKYITFNFDFALNGGFRLQLDEEYNYILPDSSSCSNFKYSKESYFDDITGGWSYNTATKKIAFVYDWDSNDTEAPEGFEAEIREKTTNKFILYFKDLGDGYGVSYEFTKK